MSTLFDPEIPAPTVGALLRLNWNAFRRRLYESVVAAGFDDLSPVEVLLFRYPTFSGRRPTQLAEEMGLSKQAVNDLLRQLEAKGYLTMKPDPTDGRARLTQATEKGEQVMRLLFKASVDISEEWAKTVGGRRFEAFRATLVDLYAAEKAGRLGEGAAESQAPRRKRLSRATT